jgi:putative lipoic acid-binding regulatory protein
MPEAMPPGPAERTGLLEFPLDFPIKIMGRADTPLADAVLAIVKRHDPDFVAASMAMRASSGGRYVSLTCCVRATSQAMLDALYRELTAHPLVQVVL